MDLILWRHAEAEPGEPDHGRTLTAKGHKQAAKMAGWLDRNLPETCRVLSSTAERCEQTAKALDRKYKLIKELAPGALPAEILNIAGWPDAREPVVIIGHQPALGQVAALLLSGTEQEWSIRKANVWWLSNRIKDDTAHVVLRAVMGPDFT
ncbi:MAG: histidine phosphatase family protein [Casimicrobiaceae bacterium]